MEIFQKHSDGIFAVLLDMRMPELDGEAAFVKLRSIARTYPSSS